MPSPTELHFDCGTLVAPTLPEDARLRALFQKDGRTGVYRAPAWHYREAVLRLRELGIPYEDKAKRFEPLELPLTSPIQPFPHQQQALEAWTRAGGRGLVELPTGAGKTLLAVLAIAHVKRPTLVVVPTLDLMTQWQGVLARHFSAPVGLLGGGVNDRQPLTVTTYDSAAMQTEFHGNRFGLLVCDECHHLPAPSYRFIAEGSLAPYRLGLTATLERADGGERVCEELLGPRVHRSDIRELQGEYLAPYEVKRVEVPLTPDEKARYDTARALYLGFVRRLSVPLSAPDGWARFLAQSQRSDEGRAAYRAYREQRRIALTSSGKQEVLWRILLEHRDDRVLVFTDDNETVYTLARRFLPPRADAPHARARAQGVAGRLRLRGTAGAADLARAERRRGRSRGARGRGAQRQRERARARAAAGAHPAQTAGEARAAVRGVLRADGGEQHQRAATPARRLSGGRLRC